MNCATDLIEHVFHAAGEAAPVGQNQQRQPLAIEVVNSLYRESLRIAVEATVTLVVTFCLDTGGAMFFWGVKAL